MLIFCSVSFFGMGQGCDSADHNLPTRTRRTVCSLAGCYSVSVGFECGDKGCGTFRVRPTWLFVARGMFFFVLVLLVRPDVTPNPPQRLIISHKIRPKQLNSFSSGSFRHPTNTVKGRSSSYGRDAVVLFFSATRCFLGKGQKECHPKKRLVTLLEQSCCRVSETNYLGESDWFVPKTGLYSFSPKMMYTVVGYGQPFPFWV